MRGEVVWFFAFDIAREAVLEKAAAAVAGRAGFRRTRPDPRAPHGTTLYSPLVIELDAAPVPGLERCGPIGRTVKIFAVGAISVEMRMPFDGDVAGAVMPLRNADDLPSRALQGSARATAEEVYRQVAAGLVRPEADWERSESYVAVCITDGAGEGGAGRAWLRENERQAAAMLLGENDPAALADEQVAESLRLSYSYGRSDLAVVDWDAMLVLDAPGAYEEVLYLAEVANMQMTELRVHDGRLVAAVDRAYDDLEAHRQRNRFLGSPATLGYALREQRVDLSAMADEILNLSKYFGDWYLAKVYTGLRARFHLDEWEEQLERKLRTVDGLYELIRREINDRRMLVLEALIVLLFVLDIGMIIMGKLPLQ